MALLGSVMKSANNLNQFVNKFNTVVLQNEIVMTYCDDILPISMFPAQVYQKQGMGRRMRGIFFWEQHQYLWHLLQVDLVISVKKFIII